jgi:hypothetical protein
MDSLAQLLKNNVPEEPPQMTALKQYVKENYDEMAHVIMSRDSYVLSVPSGGLASRLHMERQDIVTACHLDKPLRIHISHK